MNICNFLAAWHVNPLCMFGNYHLMNIDERLRSPLTRKPENNIYPFLAHMCIPRLRHSDAFALDFGLGAADLEGSGSREPLTETGGGSRDTQFSWTEWSWFQQWSLVSMTHKAAMDLY